MIVKWPIHNSLILLPLLLIVSIANGIDLIVDQSKLSQYETDNYLLFDGFGDGPSHSVTGTDEVHLWNGEEEPPDNAPTDWINYTQEALVYMDKYVADGATAHHREIMGNGHPDVGGNSSQRPPSLSIHYGNQIRYGFGIGVGSQGTREIVEETEIQQETWQHIAVTFDGENLKLYVNGELVQSDNHAGETPVAVPVKMLGSSFRGKMDEVRMWNVARTQEQIQAAMNDTLNLDDREGLVSYFTMDLNEDWKLIDKSGTVDPIGIFPGDVHGDYDNNEILQEYYSDDCPNGPDGSTNCPYPTIRSAMDDAQPGDRIYIKGGRYNELLNKYRFNGFDWPTGSVPAPTITFEGYPGEDVIIDGTVPINAEWEYHVNGIWKAVLDMDDVSKQILRPVDTLYSVFVDDRYMIPALPFNIKNPTDPTTGNPRNPEPNTVWENIGKNPFLYSPDSADAWPYLDSPAYPNGIDYYLPGEYANLDTVEEWSFDASTSTLYIYPGENFNFSSPNVRVRVRVINMNFLDSDNLEFRNIHFFAGAQIFSNCNYRTMEDCRFSFGAFFGGESSLNTGNSNGFSDHMIIRNCIFEYSNGRSPFWGVGHQSTVENVLVRYNDWFHGSANYIGGDHAGPAYYRYLTVENSTNAGLWPGRGSLVEYSRFENLYDGVDGSGIQRNGATVEYGTTRYSWIINMPGLNGMRFNSACGGTEGDVHHVVAIGASRGMKLKGDYHEVYHVTTYDNRRNDISLGWGKYCGPDRAGATEPGNVNSRILNSIAESSLDCTSLDCVPSAGLTEGDSLIDDATKYEAFAASGIWYGRFLRRCVDNWCSYFPSPQIELADPWYGWHAESEETLIEQFGEVPWDGQRQSYDFRPRKGSNLIDAGVIVPGINDGLDSRDNAPSHGLWLDDRPDQPWLGVYNPVGADFNHPPTYPGQNRRFVGAAPDIGAYEYGDSVYWIPGYRYPYPSVPIPNDNAVDVPIDYSVVWNYPYKKDYTGTMATVSLSGPGVNRTETFQYPNNVLFQTFQPGGTYTWSVTVDGISGGNWTFTVTDKMYPTNDRSIDTVAVDSAIIPFIHIDEWHGETVLKVKKNNMAFLRFDIPTSLNYSCTIHLNLVPENVSLAEGGGIILYTFDSDWGERLTDENNIGIIDHSLLTPLDTLYTLEPGTPVSFVLTDNINFACSNHSFALGVLDSTDNVSFYSKEKEYEQRDNNYAPRMNVWPNISFQECIYTVLPSVYPGDTDNNGVVNEYDILPLVTYFYQTGPQRCTAGYGWLPSPFDFLWVSNSAATYADANGDGIIDESDLFGIALNWGKSHGDGSENFVIDPSDSTLVTLYKPALEQLYQALSVDGEPAQKMRLLLERILGIANIPDKFSLYQNYPNPFNPITTIRYDLPEKSHVNIIIYDMLGREVTQFVNATQEAGYRSLQWDSTNSSGKPVSAGVYIYRIQAGKFMQARKMVLLK